MERKNHSWKRLLIASGAAAFVWAWSANLFAREVEYNDSEVVIHVTPGEPTQIKFPGDVTGGLKPSRSALSLERQGTDLIVFAKEGLPAKGESIIVRLKDGRSYSVRLTPSTESEPRDDVVRIEDCRAGLETEEDEVKTRDREYLRAPSSSVAGLMREMILVAEFGKKSITGYRLSDRYKGEVVLDDGTMHATIEHIFLGPNLWGYVISAKNQLDQSQKINPATFRIDGTRAISAERWELAPRPLNVEQQIAGRDDTKVYVVTRAKY